MSQSGHAPRLRDTIAAMNGLIASLIVLAAAAVSTTATGDETWAAGEIAPAQLREQLASGADALVILDVRRRDEYEAGHVPGAINIPHDEIGARLAELEASKDKPIVAYCGSGKRAAIALQALHQAGFTRLMHLTGDMPGWEPEPAGEPSRTAALAQPVPAGEYRLDKGHASLILRVNHLGFSNYTARFTRFDAQLRFDPRQLAATQLTASVDARSIEIDYPDPQYDFNADLRGEQWLDTAKHPEMTFRTTRVEDLGNQAMRVHGELTLRGVTRPLALDATYNGGYAGHALDPNARIGFSAQGVLRRSDFGIATGIPAGGSNLGVGDQVEIIIETEFSGPPMKQAESTAETWQGSFPLENRLEDGDQRTSPVGAYPANGRSGA